MKPCPTCGQPWEPPERKDLTPAELDSLSAWWHTGSTKRAADLLRRSQRTVINQLYSARIRNNVHTSVELVHLHLGELRTMRELATSHNVTERKAA